MLMNYRQSRLWGTDTNEAESSVYRSISLLVHFIPYRQHTVHVGAGGRNVDGCGSSTWKCQTLSQARDHLSGSAPFTLSIDTEATHSDELAFSSETTIKGDPATSKLIVTTTGSLSVTASTLSLSTLILDGSSLSRGSSLLALSQTGSLDINHCTFTRFTSTTDGAVFSSPLGTGTSIIIANSAFSSCTSDGKGGALFVDLSSLGEGSYSLNSLTFASSCTCSGGGKWVFLRGHNLASLVTKERWAGTFNSLSLRSDADKLWGLDLAEDVSPSLRSVSLLHFLLGSASRIPDSTIFVGQNGKDEMGCGNTESTLCKTVEWSVKEAAGSVVDLVIVSSGLLSSPIVLSNTDVKIAPSSDVLCPFVVSLDNPPSAAASMIRVERDSALALSFLSFSFSIPASIDSIIVSSSCVVNVDSCRVQKTTLSQPFLVSAQSSHTISNSTFLSSTFASSAFVLSDCHSLSVEDTRIADCSFDTSFLVGSSSQISFLSLTVSNNSIKQDTSLFALSILPKTISDASPSFSISLSSFTPSQSNPTPLFVSVASECSSNVILVNTTFSHSSSSQIGRPAVLVKWTVRQPLLLRRRVVCENCFVMVSPSQ
ncbi:hypothetical protein BLNAU_16417 [Blattamonas nauphoetae]|uniref:Uncharacterized protein n=1 Tax=Blattamonas nauphoetae TaxID=2049346 RepID=A0ABQ9X9S8_9EUKA|nr:hypothetical protein BLNAU_16417 [Blattamonas nauphoetae]